MPARRSEPLLQPETQPAAPNRNAIDYVLRTAQQEMLAISALADQKANILLGVSLIMTTAIVGVLPSTGLTVALVVLGAATVTAALLALVSLLPATAANPGEANPLYFADVGRMPFDEFRRRMGTMLSDNPSIYEAIVVDLHASATVLLRRKYRSLRAAYVAFLSGLILTVVAVVIDIAVGNI